MGANDHIKKMFADPAFVKAYDANENVTGTFGTMMLEQLGLSSVTDHTELVMADLACGTGGVLDRTLRLIPDKAKDKLDMTCTDFSEAMLGVLRDKIEKNGWKGKIQMEQADAQDTKLLSAKFTHVTLNFGPFVFKDAAAGLAEAKRLLRPGGRAGFTTWQHVGWYDDLKEAFSKDPNCPPAPTESQILRSLATSKDSCCWDDPDWVAEQLKGAGLVDVKVETAERRLSVANLDLLWPMAPNLLSLWMGPWTEEEKKKVSMPDLMKLLRQQLEPKFGDGPVTWNWTGIVATARKPE